MRKSARLAFAALALTGLGACHRAPSDARLRAMFEHGEQLCLDLHIRDAKRVFKTYLVYRPLDAGAHYYLGRTYMLSPDFRPVLAEGEYQTALRLFIEGGRVSPIERFGNDYFEMICYVDSAKVLYQQCLIMLTARAPQRRFVSPIRRARRYLRKAEAVMPGTDEVQQVHRLIEDVAQTVGIPEAPQKSAPEQIQI